jgi:hypothetical protein
MRVVAAVLKAEVVAKILDALGPRGVIIQHRLTGIRKGASGYS